MDLDFFVVYHELFHALDDQRHDIGKAIKSRIGNSDEVFAYAAALEGHATRGMIECLPMAVMLDGTAPQKAEYDYLLLDEIANSPTADLALSAAFSRLEKMQDISDIHDVPAPMVMQMVDEYKYGYEFVRGMTACWGQDAVRMILRDPPRSSEQVMHPDKYWRWRDWPTEVVLPEDPGIGAAGSFKMAYDDTAGESGVKIYFDYHLGDGCGSGPADGWGGDRMALYEGGKAGNLFVWATSWDSEWDAREFLRAYRNVQGDKFNAEISVEDKDVRWKRPDGVLGLAEINGREVMIFETDATQMPDLKTLRKRVTFKGPAAALLEARRKENCLFLRYNPILSYEVDGESSSGSCLSGLAARCRISPVGVRESFLMGLFLNSMESDSYHYISGLAGLAACYETDSTRSLERLTVLPLGMLWSEARSAHPSLSGKTIEQKSILWGLIYGQDMCSVDETFKILPWGALFRYSVKPDGARKVRVLGVRVYNHAGEAAAN